MKKQEFKRTPLKHIQLHIPKSINELLSEQYSISANNIDYNVFHTIDFDYVIIPYTDPTSEHSLIVHFLKHPNNFCPQILPTTKEIKFLTSENNIKITLKRALKFVLVDPTGAMQPLYILFTRKVLPPKNATFIFPSGKITNIECLELHSGDVAYLEEGAIVCGRFVSRMANNITITGNGILYGGGWHPIHENGSELMIQTVLGENIRLEGLTIIDGGSWHVVPVACRDVIIEDCNVLGTVITGDGIDIVGSENVKISNCFVRANDDCISIKACDYQDPSGCCDVHDINISNCSFWNAEFGNVLEIGYETRCNEISRVRFSDSSILNCDYEGNQSGGCLTIHNADRAFIHDIVYQNINIENAKEKFIDIKVLDSKYSTDRQRGKIENITFNNIKVESDIFPVSIIRGYEMDNAVSRPNYIIFNSIIINGLYIKNPFDMHMVKELCNNVEFY